MVNNQLIKTFSCLFSNIMAMSVNVIWIYLVKRYFVFFVLNWYFFLIICTPQRDNPRLWVKLLMRSIDLWYQSRILFFINICYKLKKNQIYWYIKYITRIYHAIYSTFQLNTCLFIKCNGLQKINHNVILYTSV